jgi:5-formyltetrahydrofolate cyclo-ligase
VSDRPPKPPRPAPPPHGVDPGPAAPHSHALAPEEVIRFKVKAELRKRMRGVRKTTPIEACEARSSAIIARLEAHEAMQNARRVALFWPIVARHEVDLRPLDAKLRARGVEIAYPALDADTNVMYLRVVSDLAALEERGYGFAEPSNDAPEAKDLDVIVVPALAVDPTGHRIGYGAGYYDRTLPRYAPPAVPIAVIYDWQLVAEVPATEGDVRIPFVVTDSRTIDARAPR